MPALYLPGEKTLEKIQSLVQGFWIEIDDEDTVVIIFKFEASVITNLIKGCKFELVLRNPKITERSITLYVYDNAKNPLWITAQAFGKEDKIYKGFDQIVVKLMQALEVRIAYFNHANLPVFTTTLKKESEIEKFQNWIMKIYSTDTILEKVKDGYYHPETEDKGFKISIQNIDKSNEEKIKIYSLEQELDWGENWIDGKQYYSFDEYLKDGKHGYNQELSIRSHLSRYFVPNQELFHSPEKIDGNELTDFLIEYKKAALIIESKYIISDKQTKFNAAIIKAITQLNSAEDIVLNNLELVANQKLQQKLTDNVVIIKICLYNDNITITEKMMKNAVEKFDKEDLPMFISATVFFQLLGSIKIQNEKNYKFNIIQNLINIYEEFLKSESKVLVLKEFRMNNE